MGAGIGDIVGGVGQGVGAMMSGIGSLVALSEAIHQRRQGERELKALHTPLYSTPEAIKDLNTISSLRYFNPELAGGRGMEEKIGTNEANTISAAKDFGSSADIYKAGITADNSLMDLGMQGAIQRLSNEKQMMETDKLLADYQDKEFDTNIYIPYQEKRQAALSKISAGAQNQQGALNTVSGMGASLMANPNPFGIGNKKTTALPSPSSRATGGYSSVMSRINPTLSPDIGINLGNALGNNKLFGAQFNPY